MKTLNLQKKFFLKPLFNKCSPSKYFASTKLSYGQGGQLKFNLTRYNYHIQFETIWEDHCLINVEGIDGYQPLKINEEGSTGKAQISDEGISIENTELVKIDIKIPQDFTFYGNINGSIQHTKSQVSNKLRCYETQLNFMGNKRIFQWGSIQTPQIKINNNEGAIDINNLTCQTGTFNCHSFSAQKLLLSQKANIKANHSISCRSIVTYGSAEVYLKTCYLQLDSISGKSQIEAQKVKIDRIWASPNGINISARQIQKIGIETGSGIIHSKQKLDLSKISLGRLHKGKVIQVDDNIVKIV